MSQNNPEQITLGQNNQEQTMRAFFAAHYRKPLRGLKATTKEPSFQGRFGRMFPHSPSAATYGKTDGESRDALMALGEAMTSDFDKPKDGFDGEESGIPALYTYFGQFIDHDITFDPMTTLTQHSDPDAITDFRTPALDLDNVYGRGPNDQPYMYDNNGTKFLLGAQLDKVELNSNPRDLQRNNQDPARALIGDPRNDENSIVSQFQALMLRFHNHLVEDKPGLSFPSLQQIVRWHYQWVIVHDFLPRLISKDVLDALKTHGHYDQKKLKFYHWKNNPFMPVEFSAATYRLGHSMVRPGYRLNDGDATLLPIFPVPEDGLLSGLTGFQAVAKTHAIDWGRFIDVGEPRAYGGDPDPRETSTGDTDTPTEGAKKPTTEDMKKRLQFAYRLDTSVVTPLGELPESVAPDIPRSLAQRNLIRGFELGLPTGQSVARAMGITPLTDDEIIIGKAVDDPPGEGDVKGPISTLPGLHAFRDKCPLWTYILAEAAHNRIQVSIPVTPATQVTTPQLGQVGGRIVAEVFLGMLFGDKDSFLSADPKWKPTIATQKTKANETKEGDFRLRDLVAYALGEGE
jgi:hypothetical protein